MDNLGFNVYRDDDGQRTKLNPSVIAGSALLVGPGTALTAGRSYVWWDTSAAASPNAQYWLEDIDLSGQRTWHGPAAIDRSASPEPPPPTGQGQAALLSSLGRVATDKPPPECAGDPACDAVDAVCRALPYAGRPLAERSAVKLSVRQEGWYRVTQAELVAAGLDPGVDPRLLHLYVDGHEIPILMTGQADGQFDQDDSLEFYGLGLDESWTDSRVYWLVVGARPGQRIARVSAPWRAARRQQLSLHGGAEGSDASILPPCAMVNRRISSVQWSARSRSWKRCWCRIWTLRHLGPRSSR